MPLTREDLRTTPLADGLTDKQLDQLGSAFERRELAEGERLFTAGTTAQAFYLLVSGEVTLSEGDAVRFVVRPPAPLGELGVLSPNIKRNTTATATKPSVIWTIARERLATFIKLHADIGLQLYENLVQTVAAKIRRDQLRLEDMRRNLIRTQKSMKELRNFVLDSEDTPVSERIHDKLDELIRHNRRANYRVAPPKMLPAWVCVEEGARHPVVEISRTHLSFRIDGVALPEEGRHIVGVIGLAEAEMPFSGKVLRTIDARVDVELDLLIDEYVAQLESYLSRVQMLDFVV